MQIPTVSSTIFNTSPTASRRPLTSGKSTLPRLAGGLLLALALSACGGKEMVKGDNLALGGSSIEIAQAAGADEFAPVEMKNARSKLDRARQLLQDGKRDEAQRLADEADADAQLAHAKASYMRSGKSLAEVQASIAAMRAQNNTIAP